MSSQHVSSPIKIDDVGSVREGKRSQKDAGAIVTPTTEMCDLVSCQSAIRCVRQQGNSLAPMLTRNFLRPAGRFLNVLEYHGPVANSLVLDPPSQRNDRGIFGGTSDAYNYNTTGGTDAHGPNYDSTKGYS